MVKMFSDDRKENKIQDEQPAVVHYVPFRVEYDGSANVGTKFSSKSVEKQDDSTEDKDVVFENQFRGKPLMGKRLDLPDDYEGIVCTDFSKSSSLQNSDVKESSTTCLVKGFTSMTYWNWDKPPSGMDTQVQLLDWLNLSKVLHEPIEFEEES